LKAASQSRFTELAETGMGYHFVKARYEYNSETGFVVLGSNYALPVHKINDLSTVFDVTKAVGLDELSEDNFIDGDLEITDNYSQDPLKAREALSLVVPGTIKATTPPPGTTLTVKTITNGVDGFIRFSYTSNDTHIQATGTVAAKTYATTYRDGVIITSGLSAVGRYALPVPLPAIYLFLLTPPAGTPVHFGATVPLFGQAGGGVEVYFPNGFTNITRPFTVPPY
jgi:hypothetical protein